jgi:hypothetical protein
MMGRDGAGKSGGSGTVMGTAKCLAQRRRSVLIHVSLSVVECQFCLLRVEEKSE